MDVKAVEVISCLMLTPVVEMGDWRGWLASFNITKEGGTWDLFIIGDILAEVELTMPWVVVTIFRLSEKKCNRLLKRNYETDLSKIQLNRIKWTCQTNFVHVSFHETFKMHEKNTPTYITRESFESMVKNRLKQSSKHFLLQNNIKQKGNIHYLHNT